MRLALLATLVACQPPPEAATVARDERAFTPPARVEEAPPPRDPVVAPARPAEPHRTRPSPASAHPRHAATPAPARRAASTAHTRPVDPPAPVRSAVAPSTCCKVCRKGKACGNTCISAAKACEHPPGCACNG